MCNKRQYISYAEPRFQSLGTPKWSPCEKGPWFRFVHQVVETSKHFTPLLSRMPVQKYVLKYEQHITPLLLTNVTNDIIVSLRCRCRSCRFFLGPVSVSSKTHRSVRVHTTVFAAFSTVHNKLLEKANDTLCSRLKNMCMLKIDMAATFFKRKRIRVDRALNWDTGLRRFYGLGAFIVKMSSQDCVGTASH